MKTKSDYLKNHASYPRLSKVVLKQGGVKWRDLVQNINDYRDPSNGSVPGFVYYKDTERFVRKHIDLIIPALNDFEQEVGPIHRDEYLLNRLAWFAWEYVASEIQSYLEC